MGSERTEFHPDDAPDIIGVSIPVAEHPQLIYSGRWTQGDFEGYYVRIKARDRSVRACIDPRAVWWRTATDDRKARPISLRQVRAAIKETTEKLRNGG